MKQILVCIDFHKETKKVLDKGIELAKAFHSKVWLLHVAAPDPDFVGYDVGPQYIRDDLAKKLKGENQKLNEIARTIREKYDLDSDSLLIQGPTIEMIIKKSKDLNVDLIVTGHHHRGFFFKMLSQHTSSSLISKSDIPVMVIPLDD